MIRDFSIIILNNGKCNWIMGDNSSYLLVIVISHKVKTVDSSVYSLPETTFRTFDCCFSLTTARM